MLQKHRHHKPGSANVIDVCGGHLHHGDALEILAELPPACAQLVIADPPYFRVLDEAWDNGWASQEAYLTFTEQWVAACRRILRDDGLLYVFGQLGKREHVWLHSCSMLTRIMQFHDMLIWDRAVGYNERRDSFTPQYEMILSLRKSQHSAVYFDKDAVRLPYEQDKIEAYLRDKRYKDKEARRRHLLKGRYATNILRVPSLKGSSREKVGHPAQKPILLIQWLIRSGSREGDLVVDPFLGSGTTAAAAFLNNRRWMGIERSRDYVEMAKRRLNALDAEQEAQRNQAALKLVSG